MFFRIRLSLLFLERVVYHRVSLNVLTIIFRLAEQKLFEFDRSVHLG